MSVANFRRWKQRTQELSRWIEFPGECQLNAGDWAAAGFHGSNYPEWMAIQKTPHRTFAGFVQIDQRNKCAIRKIHRLPKPRLKNIGAGDAKIGVLSGTGMLPIVRRPKIRNAVAISMPSPTILGTRVCPSTSRPKRSRLSTVSLQPGVTKSQIVNGMTIFGNRFLYVQHRHGVGDQFQSF